jgi:hypothetical protein
MPEQKIENSIYDVLTGDMQKNALELASFLETNEMLFERGKGYWEDKHYWMIKYKDEYICFILIGSEDKIELESWIIWSDDSDSNCFADFPLDENMKKIFWKNINICGNCGGCSHYKNPGGKCKTIFGKEFDNVCITTMKFTNPDVETIECLKKMVEIRKNDIFKKYNTKDA